ARIEAIYQPLYLDLIAADRLAARCQTRSEAALDAQLGRFQFRLNRQVRKARRHYEGVLQQIEARCEELLGEAREAYEARCEAILRMHGDAPESDPDGELARLEARFTGEMQRIDEEHRARVDLIRARHREATGALAGRWREGMSRVLADLGSLHAAVD